MLFRETPIKMVQAPQGYPGMHPSAHGGASSSTRPVEGEDYPPNEMIPVRGVQLLLGKLQDFPSFGWDNE